MQQQPFYGHGIPNFPALNFDVSAGLGLPQAFSSQVSQSTGLQAADPNSPEVFKQNIQLALALVHRVLELARNALAGIEHAYRHQTSPVQTAADIATLKQALLALVDHLRHSGVGALPLDSVVGGVPDEQLIGEATRAVQVLYERQKRIQDGAGVVGGLLSFGTGPVGGVAGEGSGQGSQSQGSGPGGRRAGPV